MKHKFSPVFISALVILIALAGCSRTRSDSEITGDALVRIHADTALASSAINVQTTGGVVTLTGTVATDTARTAAENAVKQVQGVKGVANNIQVVATTAATAPESMAPAPPNTGRGRPARKLRKPAEKPLAQPPTPGTSVAQATPPPAVETPKPPALPQTVTIPEGTVIPIRLIDPVDTEKNKEGDTFRASLDAPILMNDKTVISKDADVEARLVSAKSAGHFTGSSAVVLVLTKIAVGNKVYPVQTGQFTKQGGSRGKRTAIIIGGGAAAGAAIGGIVGGGKGAAIGAAAGAGAGTGVQALTKGEQIKLPAETFLEFQLKAPLTVTPEPTGGD